MQGRTIQPLPPDSILPSLPREIAPKSIAASPPWRRFCRGSRWLPELIHGTLTASPLQKSLQNRFQFLDSSFRPQFAVGDERGIERKMFRPARLLRDARNYVDEHLLGRFGVRDQMTDDDLRGDRFLLNLPAI